MNKKLYQHASILPALNQRGACPFVVKTGGLDKTGWVETYGGFVSDGVGGG